MRDLVLASDTDLEDEIQEEVDKMQVVPETLSERVSEGGKSSDSMNSVSLFTGDISS